MHAPTFPFERTEQWMVLLSCRFDPEATRRVPCDTHLLVWLQVLLVDVKANKLVGYQKLSQNSRYETVNLKFLAPKEAPAVLLSPRPRPRASITPRRSLRLSPRARQYPPPRCNSECYSALRRLHLLTALPLSCLPRLAWLAELGD